MRLLPTRAQFWEFVRYSVVGTSSTVLEYGLLWVLTDVCGWHPLIANPLAFLVGVTNGFVWNRHWTFHGARREEPVGQYVRFVLVNIGGMAIDEAILAIALAMGPMVGLTAEVSKWTGKIVAIPFIVIWNFTANSRWTFRRRHELALEHETPSCPLSKPPGQR
jgi:putative flippase GtrA